MPAASRYSATTPTILGWFRGYNEGRDYTEQIRPFGFLTWLHVKRPQEHFWGSGPDAETWEWRTRAPKPVAPYDRDISKAAESARDRETWEPVPLSWLRTYAEALRQYHIHPETKFLYGGHTQSGQLKRRHVFATAAEYIGKEADNWEEDSHFGAAQASAIAYGLAPADRERMIEVSRQAVRVERIGVKQLAKQAGLADRAVTRVVTGDAANSSEEILRLYRAAEHLLARKRSQSERIAELLEWARAQPRGWLAAQLEYDLSNLAKVLAGKIKPKEIIERLRALRAARNACL